MKRLISYCATVFTLALLVSTAPVHAAQANPAGNNGVVKINNEVAPDTIPQNHPHVNCAFTVEFYNYDKNNDHAKVRFDLQSPTATSGDRLTVTSGNLAPSIGADAAAGGNDLDARETYTLSFTGKPQPNQGYHVKLTVEAPGSKGSDKKQKVFWVQPCAEAKAPVTPQILGSSTSNASSQLPNTGNNLTSVLVVSGIAATGGYLLSYLRRKRAHSQS